MGASLGLSTVPPNPTQASPLGLTRVPSSEHVIFNLPRLPFSTLLSHHVHIQISFHPHTLLDKGQALIFS